MFSVHGVLEFRKLHISTQHKSINTEDLQYRSVLEKFFQCFFARCNLGQHTNG